jgi:hypothetical protein
MEITQEQKLYQKVVKKAWDDTKFKEELVSNPVATIEKFTGKKLHIPEGKIMVVKDQTDDSTVFFNIPAKPNMDDVELNEEQLEAVSGGDLLGAAWEVFKTPYTLATEGMDAYVDAVSDELK